MNRLLQQEYMMRSESFDDNTGTMLEKDSDLFQRRGVITAFDSLEQAKR
jgi:hypothetical protein